MRGDGPRLLPFPQQKRESSDARKTTHDRSRGRRDLASRGTRRDDGVVAETVYIHPGSQSLQGDRVRHEGRGLRTSSTSGRRGAGEKLTRFQQTISSRRSGLARVELLDGLPKAWRLGSPSVGLDTSDVKVGLRPVRPIPPAAAGGSQNSGLHLRCIRLPPLQSRRSPASTRILRASPRTEKYPLLILQALLSSAKPG